MSKTLPDVVQQKLLQCWAKGMTVSSTFAYMRANQHPITYQQITDYFNSRSNTFESQFAMLFKQ